MTDSNYIPPSELDRYRPMIHHETGERTPGDIGLSNLMLLQVIESHAVVDSIAAELADALRSLIGDPIPDGVAGIHYRQHGALQRFDNLTKGTK